MSFQTPTPIDSGKGLQEAHQGLYEACQRKRDEAIGWRPNYFKRLRIKSGGVVTGEFLAEVCYDPGFGFRPNEWAIVRIRQFDLLCCQIDITKDITLLEGENLFGPEGFWHVDNQKSQPLGNGLLDLFLAS